ncbi:MAG: esterase-like activity of phytase family protein [Pseudomonadota bacterium]
MRLFAAAVVALVAVGAQAEPVSLDVKVLPRFSVNPMAEGRLAYVGGLRLRGPRRFGGVSGLLADKGRFVAATDTGHFITGAFVTVDGRLTGVRDVAMTRRIGLDGRAITTKRAGDAEALARDDRGLLVLVEQGRALLRYRLDGALRPSGAPARVLGRAGLRPLGNDGAEALATLPSGDVIVIAEGRRATRPSVAALTLGGRRLRVRQSDGFAITGADALPGGDLLLVERRYGGGLDVGARVRRIGRDTLKRGTLDGPVLMRAGLSAEIDNMEAIAVDASGERPLITLASDDNHSFWQRTVFLQFVLDDPLPRPKPSPNPG